MESAAALAVGFVLHFPLQGAAMRRKAPHRALLQTSLASLWLRFAFLSPRQPQAKVCQSQIENPFPSTLTPPDAGVVHEMRNPT
jgi:hypothetical protein